MRKKYLSALLFGALLFASAGTFTSCKDYDDDINNLQEQINTVKTSLDELSEKINSLGAGVTDFKYEGGKLILSTDKGTNFEVTLPEDKVGITTVEVKDGYLWIDGVKGDAIATEGEAIDVRVDENGILYINDEPQDLKDEVGSKVIMVDNNNGTYTLTVDGASYVLPKASAAVSISISDNENTTEDGYSFFTNLSQVVDAGNTSYDEETEVTLAGGILWGTADQYKGNWKGLKSVEKGQLLVGQIKTLDVKVSPATFDLKTVKLSLVNTLGEEAPVTVNPVAEGKYGPSLGGSRAADANGNWTLNIQMKDEINAENITTAFAEKDVYDDYKYKNVKYALAVEGKVVTDYSIFIDTDTKATTASISALRELSVKFGNKNFDADKVLVAALSVSGITDPTEALPLGETTLYLDGDDENVDKVYDAYIEIMDQNMADAYGIEVNGMTITASQAAGNLEDFPIKIHVIDVTGKEQVSGQFMIKFDKSTESGVEIGTQVYKVMPTSAEKGAFVLVDLGETFTSLSDEDAHKISRMSGDGGAIEWYTTTDANTFAVTGTPIEGGIAKFNQNNAIMYYASKEDALKDAMTGEEVDANGDKLAITVAGGKASTIKTITYAAIPVSAFKTDAKVGANDLTIIMSGEKDGRVNEIKRATTTLTVAIPEFDEVLEANTVNNLWNEAKDTYSTRIYKDAQAPNNPKIQMLKPFVSKKDANDKQYFDINTADEKLKYELTYKDFNNQPQLSTKTNTDDHSIALPGVIVKDHKLIETVNAEATLYLFGTTYKNLKVTKNFKVDVMSIFENAQVAYYDEDDNLAAEGAYVPLKDHKYLTAGYLDGKDKKNGLFLEYNGEKLPFSLGNNSTAFLNGVTVLKPDVREKAGTPDNMEATRTPKQINSYIYLGEGATGSMEYGTIRLDGATRGVLEITTLDASTQGTVEFTFVDEMDVYTTVSVNYKK
ncbi:hypothetical protein [Phocaeicola barnesiae]|uniref:hypothetical protein n=1 Tax=Phocaeicola barnesiae TaxID=376804 RepID=UPI000379218F|nr:hypothetical protein [Phocaeicola barnesiae]